jgi:hypothetical protein
VVRFAPRPLTPGKELQYWFDRKLLIIDSPECPCEAGHQTVEHLIYECHMLQTERENLISNIAKRDNLPMGKSELVNKYIKHFIQFTNSIDFEKL